MEDPNQPRKDPVGLEALARSLEMTGQTTPILVSETPDPGVYLVVDGWRRCSAARRLRWEAIDCIITDVSEDERSDVQFAVAFFHCDLNPFERADELAKIKERHRWSDQRLADYLGRARSEISSILKLRSLPEDIKSKLRPICADLAMDSLYQVTRAADPEQMEELVELLLHAGSTGDLRAARRSQKQSSEALKKNAIDSKKKAMSATNTASGRSLCDEMQETASVPTIFAAEPEAFTTVPKEHDAGTSPAVELPDVVEASKVLRREEDALISVQGDKVNASEAERECATSQIALEQMVTLSPEVPVADHGTSIDERFVSQWWNIYSVHAVRVTQLKAVVKAAGFERFDISAWLERAQGTAILGFTVVVVPVVQDKRVYQLVPERLSRPIYVDQMHSQLLEMNEKLAKNRT